MQQKASNDPPATPREGSIWGHLLVSVCACVLTVSIFGSATFLGWRMYERHQLKSRVKAFVSSLENRTPEELAERAAKLKLRPKVAKYVLPHIRDSITAPGSERQKRAAIQISRAFIDAKSIEKTLFELRQHPNENIASAAVEALGDLKPPKHAAKVLGDCLEDALTPSARDEACAGLFRLDEIGRAELEKRLSKLEVGRRIWLVRFVAASAGPQRAAWLDMLSRDGELRVREAAEAAKRDHQRAASSRSNESQAPLARAGSND